MLRWSLVLLPALVACSSGDPAPAPVVPIEGELATPPAGTGTLRIDMRGTWEITAFEVERWDGLRYEPSISPEGQEFEIEQGSDGRYWMRSFAWLPDLGMEALAQGWNVNWHRNEGDGKLLIFSIATWPPPGTLFPATVGIRKSYMLGMALGSVDEQAVRGQFVETGRMEGDETSFVFTARRTRP